MTDDGTPAERGQDGAQYYRVAPEVKLTDSSSITVALDLFGSVIHYSVIGVSWDCVPNPGSKVSEFRSLLHSRWNVIDIPAQM